MDEDIDDIDTDQGWEEACSSDKFPVEEDPFEQFDEIIPDESNNREKTPATPQVPPEEKIPHNAETGNEECIAHEVAGSSMEGYRCRRQAW